MTLALGLLAAAIVIGVAAPAYLRLAVTPRVRPGLALAGWASSVLAVSLLVPAAGLLLAFPAGSGLDGLIGMANTCVNAVLSRGEVVWADIARLGGAAVLLGMTVRVIAVALVTLRRHRRDRREHVTLLRAVGHADGRVLWIETPVPVAYSVGGRDATIVATRGVARLSAPERDAVLAHEQAHLRGRHHLLVLLADIAAVALPFIPLFRLAPDAVRVLVELAADADAARRHGPGPVRSALLSVTAGQAPNTALAMSRDAVDARLLWLENSHLATRRMPVRAGYALATVVTTVPALLAVAAVAALVTLYCLVAAG
ncbi:M56 family metallopeptidase [Saccharomonospora xinjiangensis]|uniref:Antirepressor regulating drug resistance protein n=1 Tax=Saccharomonospora xinjiangensis XJ-54 TaxID=882086 RepID=I0V828_9PSEU|nr:M56 family metallopeptidase [Saccharomonospora xinjiangensis]EID56281.1 antirepressor regulating drug resistance protein [Saccharomonospora xinjiangensis XJ-54]